MDVSPDCDTTLNVVAIIILLMQGKCFWEHSGLSYLVICLISGHMSNPAMDQIRDVHDISHFLPK